MSILVVGSVAFDSIQTPSGAVDHCLGGAATHFALAASYFTDVRVIAVVGKDFTADHEAVFTKRGIDTRGIERADGLSFHWSGSYVASLNEAQTLGTDLNVFQTFEPCFLGIDAPLRNRSHSRRYRFGAGGPAQVSKAQPIENEP